MKRDRSVSWTSLLVFIVCCAVHVEFFFITVCFGENLRVLCHPILLSPPIQFGGWGLCRPYLLVPFLAVDRSRGREVFS